MMNTVIIQPPLVQLNTPYPSGAYLFSFFITLYKQQSINGNIKWLDFSTGLFHSVFSRKGLNVVFEKSYDKALSIADEYESKGDEDTAFQLRRFVSESEKWINWIDLIVSIVCQRNGAGGREYVHEFVRSAHVPRGNRMEKYLSSLNRDVCADDSQILASLALADITDYISFVYDKNFSLIRYAEHIAASTSSFDAVISSLSSPVLKDIYLPYVKEQFSKLENKPTLFCISIPFPGTFVAGIFTAKIIKEIFGENALISFGGGYINTELRNVKETRLFEYCDFLSYDKGYGSYKYLFDELKQCDYSISAFKKTMRSGKLGQLYKIRYRTEKEIIAQLENSEELELFEKNIVKSLVPDFTEIDFTKSPCLADDENAMHRIWNDGAWLKAYLAYGCYWHRCAFCDTSLDYVKNYCCTDAQNLFNGLYEQAEKTGIYGIHFVDEACPPSALQKFAICNSVKENNAKKLTFWGNIRFEKTFTRDLVDLLSFGGMTAVSAGIEIATGKGLDFVNKGTDIKNIVFACCALKEAGILVHSYMIFGFWNQSKQDLIDSMECLRQMFEEGLIDSAFWHKFSLTLHSTVYKEWLEGKHPELKPILPKKTQFAENDIHFEGEENSEKYSIPLNSALENWMHQQNLSKNVETYFPFKMPKPSIDRNFVKKLISQYENKRDAEYSKLPENKERFVWLGGQPFVLKSMNMNQLCYCYMGEMFYVDVFSKNEEKIVELLKKIKVGNYTSSSEDFLGRKIVSVLGEKMFKELRGKGLCSLM